LRISRRSVIEKQCTYALKAKQCSVWPTCFILNPVLSYAQSRSKVSPTVFKTLAFSPAQRPRFFSRFAAPRGSARRHPDLRHHAAREIGAVDEGLRKP
jgi:hypothetical protein